jgi:hypothetical protein
MTLEEIRANHDRQIAEACDALKSAQGYDAIALNAELQRMIECRKLLNGAMAKLPRKLWPQIASDIEQAFTTPTETEQ